MKKSTKIKIWAYFMRLGNRAGCHQREDRSFHIGEWQFPICSRCTGILTGQILAVILYCFQIRVPIPLGIFFLGLLFFDWYLQYKKIKESSNIRRFITGNLAGIAQISMVIEVVIYLIGGIRTNG